MRNTTLVILLAGPLALAACGSGAETAPKEDMAMEGHDMSTMNHDEDSKVINAKGTVTAIDAEAGTITIDHEPVTELEWPQMNMGFSASEKLRGDVSVGDAIAFQFTSGDEGNVVISVTKQ